MPALKSVLGFLGGLGNFDDYVSGWPDNRAGSSVQRLHPDSHGLQADQFRLTANQNTLCASQMGLNIVLNVAVYSDFGERRASRVIFARPSTVSASPE